MVPLLEEYLTEEGQDTPVHFAERLRQERLARNLSQEALAGALGVSPRSIIRWEQGQSLPQLVVRLHLCHFFKLRPEDLFEDQEAVPSFSSLIWAVPYPRNPFFTGREELLAILHSQLTAEQSIALTQASALSGLGGIGKTQVAIEYAYSHAQEYSAVLWLAAETTESLMLSLQQIASQLQLPEQQAREQLLMVAAVQRWLAMHSGWLLIADNMEDPDVLQKVLPPVRQGALLLTTRRQAMGMLALPLELQPMSNQEGALFVLRRARRLNSSLATTDLLPENDLNAAISLVKLLEGLPLALDQAGAYIEETGCSVNEYIERYHSQRKQVLARRGLHGGAHPDSVTTTLMLSIEQVEQVYPSAIDLLIPCAFLHSEAIPEEVLLAEAGSSVVLAVDPYQFDLALAALRSASLITRHPETRTLSVHRLVQAVLQDQMEPTEHRLLCQQIIRLLNILFPVPEFDNWEQCGRYLAHALTSLSLLERTGESDLLEAGELLFKAGSYLLARGHYREAEVPLEQAVAIGERLYGPDHPTLMLWLEKQTELFWRQGKYPLAEPLLHRMLTFAEHHLGPDHLQTAETLNNLGLLYYSQEKYEEAKPLYQRALLIREQYLGPDHPQTSETLNNLAGTFWKQQKYGEAESLYLRSLAIDEKQLGPEHPDTAITLNNLAHLYRDQARYEEAELLYLRALAIYEEHLGPQHPYTAIGLRGLATSYLNQGKQEQAEPILQRALLIWKQQTEASHPETVLILNQLASLYRDQGKHEQGE